MEESILLFIQEILRNKYLNDFFTFITHLGDNGIIWIIICIILLVNKKYRNIGIMIALSLTISFIFNNLLIKNIIMRIRPYETIDGLTRLIEAQSDYSFPSGHSASSFASAIVIFLTMNKKIGISALALALLISLSRLYVGVHYPSDVIFGIISGTIIGYLIVLIYKQYTIKKMTSN